MVDAQEIADAIVVALRRTEHTLWIDPELHSTQHEFIKMLIEERKEKKARRDRIQEKIAGSLVLTFIIGTITLIGAGALDWIRNHLK